MVVPGWLCVPFAGMLGCIALLPVIKPEWWERKQPVVVAFWSVLVIVLYALVSDPGPLSR